jgi:hypothetical protein
VHKGNWNPITQKVHAVGEGFEFRIQAVRLGVWGLGFKVEDCVGMVQGLGLGVWGGSGLWGVWLWVWGCGFSVYQLLSRPDHRSRVSGLGLRVQGLGFRVKGPGFWVPGLGSVDVSGFDP